MPCCGIAGSYDNCICFGGTDFPHQLHHFSFSSAVYEVPISPHSHQTFSPLKRIIAIIVDMRWYLVVLIYIFYRLRVLNIFSYTYWAFVFLIWRSVYSNYLSILKTELFVFLLLSYKCSLYIPVTIPSSVIWFANIFSHSVGCLFPLSFWRNAWKSLPMLSSSLFIYLFGGLCFWCQV